MIILYDDCVQHMFCTLDGYSFKGKIWRGELILFKGEVVLCKEFNEPGSEVVFSSFTNHKVNKLISGNWNTLHYRCQDQSLGNIYLNFTRTILPHYAKVSFVQKNKNQQNLCGQDCHRHRDKYF